MYMCIYIYIHTYTYTYTYAVRIGPFLASTKCLTRFALQRVASLNSKDKRPSMSKHLLGSRAWPINPREGEGGVQGSSSIY